MVKRLPTVLIGIATSVLVLGLRLAASLPLVSMFALVHGHAHHAETRDSALW